MRIQAKVEGDNVAIRISDNGVGMDADAFNLNLQKNDIHYIEEGNSIGLYNINARLKMLYGESYGLHITSVIGEGTEVYMAIPREKRAGREDGEEKI